MAGVTAISVSLPMVEAKAYDGMDDVPKVHVVIRDQGAVHAGDDLDLFLTRFKAAQLADVLDGVLMTPRARRAVSDLLRAIDKTDCHVSIKKHSTRVRQLLKTR